MDRPSRKTKVVNYSEFKDLDDDDDFACVKAPPSKRAREDVVKGPCTKNARVDVTQHGHNKSSSKSSSQESNTQLSLIQTSRKPLDEKVLHRDLEAAIALSLLNNADGIKGQFPTTEGDAVSVILPVDKNTDPSSPQLSNCSVDTSLLGLDEITSEKNSPAPSRQRKVVSKATEEQRKTPQDEDEDYQPKLTPESESDDDFSEPAESEDEEFTVKKIHKAKKEKVTNTERVKQPPVSKKEKQPSNSSKSKSQSAASTPVRSPPTAKLAAKRPAASSTVPMSKPAVSISPTGGRIPKWNPPGQKGRSPTSSQSPALKSPGQGLRLGLSRRVRVKPLHPSVASH